MPALNMHTVTTLAQFTEKVKLELLAGRARREVDGAYHKNWYRGHASASYLLKPSLFRHPSATGWANLYQLEAKMLKEFTSQSFLHGPLEIDEAKPIKNLFLMQHYGVPTRLLDWTSNPFISLHFALAETSADDAVVWILDPVSWNKTALSELGWGEEGALQVGDTQLTSYAPARAGEHPASPYIHPAALLGVPNSARMFAQRGVFTISGRDTESMETMFSRPDSEFDNGALVKIIIPTAYRQQMLEDLNALGYTDSVAYPDLQGLAMEIKHRFGFRR